MPIDTSFVSSHLLWAISHLFSRRKPSKKRWKKDHVALDESSSEQQVHESVDYTLTVRKTGALGLVLLDLMACKQADKIILVLEIFKILERANLEAFSLFEQRYSVLSTITSIVVGFLCSNFYNVGYS